MPPLAPAFLPAASAILLCRQLSVSVLRKGGGQAFAKEYEQPFDAQGDMLELSAGLVVVSYGSLNYRYAGTGCRPDRGEYQSMPRNYGEAWLACMMVTVGVALAAGCQWLTSRSWHHGRLRLTLPWPAVHLAAAVRKVPGDRAAR